MVRGHRAHLRGSDGRTPAAAEVADTTSTTRLPTTVPGGGLKVMLCGRIPARTRNERATAGAASKSSLPPCTAVMVQVPAARVVTLMGPETLQTAGVAERKLTRRPEVAVALMVTRTPAVAPPGWTKLIVWVALTRNDRVVSGAAA